MGRRIFKSSAQTDLLMFATHHVPLMSTIWSWKKAYPMFCAWHWDELTPPVFLKQHNVCRAPIKPTTTINKIHLVHLFVWGFFYVQWMKFSIYFLFGFSFGLNQLLEGISGYLARSCCQTHVYLKAENLPYLMTWKPNLLEGPAANFSISPTYKKSNPRMMMKLLMRHQQIHWYVLLIIN